MDRHHKSAVWQQIRRSQEQEGEEVSDKVWDGPNARAEKDTEGLERAVELRDRMKRTETPLSNERLAELIRGWHNVAALDAGAKDVLAALRELQSARERVAGLEAALKEAREVVSYLQMLAKLGPGEDWSLTAKRHCGMVVWYPRVRYAPDLAWSAACSSFEEAVCMLAENLNGDARR